eukprot:3525528-Rhodomonas_salina.3
MIPEAVNQTRPALEQNLMAACRRGGCISTGYLTPARTLGPWDKIAMRAPDDRKTEHLWPLQQVVDPLRTAHVAPGSTILPLSSLLRNQGILRGKLPTAFTQLERYKFLHLEGGAKPVFNPGPECNHGNETTFVSPKEKAWIVISTLSQVGNESRQDMNHDKGQTRLQQEPAD